MKKKLQQIIKILVFISLSISFLSFFKINFYVEIIFFKLITFLALITVTLIFSDKYFKYLIANKKESTIEQFFLKRERVISNFLLIIFFIFLTIFRVKFFNTPFTTDHPMKYAAYVEPANYIVKSKNIFNYQKKYYLNNVSNLEGEKLDLNHFPIFEWLLASTYYFLNIPIELATRIFLHLLLITNLTLIYIYLSKKVSYFTSVLATSVIALNPIINFSHYVTVIDSLLITFTFLSLILFEKYQKNRNVKYLILSAITLGIGTITKSSIFIWTYPIVFISSFLKNNKNYKKTIIENFIFLFLSLGQFIPLVLVVFNYSKISLYQNILNNFIWFITIILIYKFTNEFLFKKLNKLPVKTIYFFSIFLISISSISLFLLKEKIFFYADDFLTSKNLIFYLPMYEKIFKNLLVFIVEPIIFYVFIFFSYYFIYKNNNKQRN